jgi:flagellar motility protein MotE (MotC chaperone)
MKYINLISLSADETKKQDLELTAEDAKLSSQQKLLTIKRQIAKVEKEISTLKKAIPLSVSSIIEKMDELQLLERNQKQVLALQEELF